jgi:hypothetical protein
VTIALFPRRTDAIGRFARFSAVRAAAHRTMPRAAATPAINAGRWATLPGEYNGPRVHPLDRALPAITAPGISEPVTCVGYGPVTLHLAGTWAGRVAFEGSMDGMTWSHLALASLDGGPAGTGTEHPGLWRTLPEQPISLIRLRVTSLAGGTILAAVGGAPAMSRAMHEALDSAA